MVGRSSSCDQSTERMAEQVQPPGRLPLQLLSDVRHVPNELVHRVGVRLVRARRIELTAKVEADGAPPEFGDQRQGRDEVFLAAGEAGDQ